MLAEMTQRQYSNNGDYLHCLKRENIGRIKNDGRRNFMEGNEKPNKETGI